MSNKTFSGSLSLSKLKHVKMTCKGKTGPIEGIFIPIEANKLVKYEKEGEISYFMPIRIIVKSEQDTNGQNGFVAKSLSTEDYKKMNTPEEKESIKEFTPILGSIKDFSFSNDSSNEGDAGQGNSYGPEDDLPF